MYAYFSKIYSLFLKPVEYSVHKKCDSPEIKGKISIT